MIAPLLLLLYFGSVEATQGFMAQQKVTHTASAIADLVAQDSSVTPAQINDIFAVGNAVMYPYSTTGLKLRVSSLAADANGNVTVAWSEGSGLTARANGSAVTVPGNVITAGGSAIMGESQYTYSSVFGQVLPQPVVFNETYYVQPRVTTSVACPTC